MDKKKLLKYFDYYSCFLDGIMSFVMIYSLFAIPPFIIPYSNASKEFRFAMGWASAFMIAWTILLFWAAQKPVERKFIIPLTLYMVVVGLALTCLIISPIELIEIWSFQILAIIVPGTVICVLTRDLKSPILN